MDTTQLLVLLTGAGGVIGTLAGIIYKLLLDRISALEKENTTLRDEAKSAVTAKDAEITTLRQIAADLAKERAKEMDHARRNQP
jgi:glutamate dehydrogenase/leucine dehydrogenase